MTDPRQPDSNPPDWGATQRYEPAPEPRSDWARPVWNEPDPHVEPWTSPAREPVAAPVAERPRRGTGIGQVLAAALISAALASGGTYLALDASGALDRTAVPAATAGNASTAGTTTRPFAIDESSAVIDVASKAGPAVVQITVEGISRDFTGQQIPETGVGSGIIYDDAGWILTNRHVVQDASGNTVSRLTVALKDGRQFSGRVYGIDTLTDLAIVKIEADKLTAVPVGNSDELKVGQLVVAIGSPLGTYSNSVTSGIVSAKGRAIDVDSGEHLTNLIQTDAAINPGNSGGPLLDAAGNVIGINTAIAREASGIGFAIPVNIARPIMQQAVAGQKLERPYIGIRYTQIDPQVAKERNLSVQQGALVVGPSPQSGSTGEAVVPGGPADKAGIKEGDVIVAIDGQPIDSEHPLDAVLSQFGPGATVRIDLLRGGQKQALSLTLGTRPADL